MPTTAVNRRDDHGRVHHQSRGIKSIAEGAVEGSRAGQPSPAAKPIVPVPTGTREAVIAETTPPTRAAVISTLCQAIAGSCFVLRTHIAPGIKIIALLGVELLRF